MGCTNSTFCPSPPLPPRQKLGVLSLVAGAAIRPNGGLRRRLLWLVEFNAPPNSHPDRGVRTTDFHVDKSRGLWVRLFLPAGPVNGPGLPVIVFFHGGGFAFCSAATREFDALCRRFCRQMCVAVVSVNYRLSPEHPFPAQYDDGIDVLRFLNSTSPLPNNNHLLREFFRIADLSLCFLVGDSAGANIAHNVARRWIKESSPVKVKLVGLVALQPFFGGERRVPSEIRGRKGSIVPIERTDWMWKAFLPKGANRDHSAANPVVSTKELGDGFPPVMVMAGELDPLLDWQRLYYESLVKNGRKAEMIEYPRAFHASYLFPRLPGSRELVRDLGSFVRRQICNQWRDGL